MTTVTQTNLLRKMIAIVAGVAVACGAAVVLGGCSDADSNDAEVKKTESTEAESGTDEAEEAVKHAEDLQAEFKKIEARTDITDGQKEALKNVILLAEEQNNSKEQMLRALEMMDSNGSDADIEFAIKERAIDWKENAARQAKKLKEEGYSDEKIKGALEFNDFTDEEVQYAMEQLNK